MMILAAYITTLFSLFFIFAGQFRIGCPFIACAAILLWFEIAREFRARLFKSTMFWLWLAFIAIAAVQLINHGEYRSLDEARNLLIFPRITWLPFTLAPKIAVVSLIAWCAIAGLCVAGESVIIRQNRNGILDACLFMAVMLATMGIAQYHAHIPGFYFGVYGYDKPLSFSIFGYVNNAATFFMLASGIALWRSKWTWPLVLLFGYCILLCQCRAMMGAWYLILAFRVLYPRNKTAWLAIIAIAITLLILLIDRIMTDRWYEYIVNWRLICAHPIFGCGVYGNTLMPSTVMDAWFNKMMQGQPNTHCDIMVTLVEYGLIGGGLLAAIAWRMLRRYTNSILLCAVLLACAHALIDMPFRCPAVVGLMVAMLLPAHWLSNSSPIADPAS